MINRELIRLRVVQLVYAFYRNEGKTLDVAEKEFFFSFDKTYELYFYMLSLLVEVHKFAVRKNETRIARMQRLGNDKADGIFPDKMVAENKFLLQLADNKELGAYMEQKKEWIEEEPFVKKLYNTLIESDIFQLYLTKEEFDYEADRELVRKFYKTYVCNNEGVEDLIEDHCLYWNDDRFVVDSFVLKTIKRFAQAAGSDQPLLPQFANEEDREFAAKLFAAAINNESRTRIIIRENCKNWEFDRLAFMDVIIMQIALAEILSFPSIPASVTVNEYLDIARVYSTPRSTTYINGLLDHAIKKLRTEGVILKELVHGPKPAAATPKEKE